jgi:hypothetical protein
MTEPATEPPAEPEESSWLWRLIGMILGVAFAIMFGAVVLAAVLAVPAALIFGMYKAFPDEKIEPKAGAGWLDTIFANQYVVFSARVVLLSLGLVLLIGGLFIVVSVIYRMYRKEFLHKIGPFEVSVAATADRDLGEIDQMYQELLSEAWQQNEELEGRLNAALAREAPEAAPAGT